MPLVTQTNKGVHHFIPTSYKTVIIDAQIVDGIESSNKPLTLLSHFILNSMGDLDTICTVFINLGGSSPLLNPSL